MGNFDFVQQTLPLAHSDCARAESYLSTDPRSACFYGRRAIEAVVGLLYDVLDLDPPYKDDLAARINDSAFKARTGNGINQKLNLIRRVSNTAVHDLKPIRPDVSVAVLRELHHVMVWAAFRYSPHPELVPTKAQFDPALAAKAAPLSRDELVKLAVKFKAQDEAHAKALAEKDHLLAAHESEIAALRQEIKAAQAATTKRIMTCQMFCAAASRAMGMQAHVAMVARYVRVLTRA